MTSARVTYGNDSDSHNKWCKCKVCTGRRAVWNFSPFDDTIWLMCGVLYFVWLWYYRFRIDVDLDSIPFQSFVYIRRNGFIFIIISISNQHVYTDKLPEWNFFSQNIYIENHNELRRKNGIIRQFDNCSN